RMGRMKRTNRRIRVPAFMRSYRIEEELILVKTFGKEVEEYVTKISWKMSKCMLRMGLHPIGYLSLRETTMKAEKENEANHRK
ncbi:hypothetical protein Tco_0425510, partial [Tanacetum coccineum]